MLREEIEDLRSIVAGMNPWEDTLELSDIERDYLVKLIEKDLM